MTNTKTTKRALLASVLSVVMCISMLIGSTFAWFTDSATTGVNTIKSGNLDVVLEMSYDGTKWEDADGQTLEFRDKDGSANILWEPGAEFKLPQLRIRNNGNLALKFKVVVSGLTGDMELADVLDVKLGGAKVDTLANVMALNEDVDGMIHGSLAEKATSAVYQVSLKMQESAGSTYMNKTLSGLAITVYAAQDTVEKDSFDDKYDENADYDLMQNERLAKNDTELASILNNLEGVDTVYLGEGTFSAFDLIGKDADLVGSVDGKGNPTTKIYIDKAPSAQHDAGIWNGYKGTVENIVFEAKDGVADSQYGGLSIGHTDWAAENEVTFKNCQFVNQGIKFFGDVDFVNCVFDGKNQAKKALDYCIVASGKTCTLTGCTIKDYTSCGINVAESAGSLEIINCNLSNCQENGEYGIHIGQINTLIVMNCNLNCDVRYYTSLTSSFIAGNNTFGEGYTLTAE